MKRNETPAAAANGPGRLCSDDDFSRADESDDRLFYARDRFVSHLDSNALSVVEGLIGRLVVKDHPDMLDLMASWDSHIPGTVQPSRLVGLGLNENELKANHALTEFLVHDINATPSLPFSDDTFDVVINTVSVDYMTQPVQIFHEVGRILKPGGLFLVIFSNRMFPQKATRIWVHSDETERVTLVERFFESSGLFNDPKVFVRRGGARPSDDKYAHLGIPGDPVYAVYADKR
jgi:SAM-dependent methyltransferase